MKCSNNELLINAKKSGAKLLNSSINNSFRNMILLKQIESHILIVIFFTTHIHGTYLLFLLNQYFKIEAVFKLFLNLQVL